MQDNRTGEMVKLNEALDGLSDRFIPVEHRGIVIGEGDEVPIGSTMWVVKSVRPNCIVLRPKGYQQRICEKGDAL